MAVVLQSSFDHEQFEVDKNVAVHMGTIKQMIDEVAGSDDSDEPSVFTVDVSSGVLQTVIYFCTRQAYTEDEEQLKEDDEELLESLVQNKEGMFEVIMAANYLDVRKLMDICCQEVADHIENMSVLQVRDYFEIENDFTREELATVMAETSWAFE